MKPLHIKALVALALMLSALAGATVWRPTARLADTRPKVDLASMFPKAFGAWQVDERMPVQLVSPDQQAVLSKIYNQTLSRSYINAQGDRIMLSVAYGGDQSDGTRAHRPEVCYPAQGFQVAGESVALLALGDSTVRARHLVARLGGRTEPITYWVVVGERITTSGTEQKLAQLNYSVRGWVPDGMLVRVSSIDNDAAHAYAVQAAFIGQLAQATAPAARPQIFGLDTAAALGSAHGR